MSTSIRKLDFLKFYVYVLLSLKDKKFYVGFTSDLKNRLIEHARGKVLATKNRRPLKLIYYEAYLKEGDAKRREKYLKGGNGRKELKIQLKDSLQELNYKFL